MKIKPLLFCHALALFLIVSFCWSPCRVIWDTIDLAIFHFLNSSLDHRPLWQLFWAFANHSLADWVEDFIFITFFAIAIYAVPKEERVRKLAQFIFCILFAAVIIFWLNRILFREYLEIPRPSPTLIVDNCIRLSEQIPWLHIKDKAKSSFPGDHATTLLLFAASYTFFAGRRLGFFAICYAIFRSLPRLIAGAHWFSDIIVGSGAIVLITLSWALSTPLHIYCTLGIEWLLNLCIPSRKLEPVNK